MKEPPSALYAVRYHHPGTPGVCYKIGSWEDVEAAKAAEAKAEASKAANPNDAGLVIDWQGELWAQTRVP